LNDIVIFDGVCNLCDHSVKFILNHEAHQTLHFTPLQSPAGARLMREFGFDPDDAKTFVLIADGRPYVRSDAAIRISRYLRGAALGSCSALSGSFRGPSGTGYTTSSPGIGIGGSGALKHAWCLRLN
jgi:DCC1-like thiol-disulfide oxidoreductase